MSELVTQTRRLLLQRLKNAKLAGIEQIPTPPILETMPAAEPAKADSASRNPASEAIVSNQRPAPLGSPGGSDSAQTMPTSISPVQPTNSAQEPTLPEPVLPKLDLSKIKTLDQLQKKVAKCTLCEELSCKRTQTVFGTGDPCAKLVFLGEAPGAEEDKQGEPFVGRSGKLLMKMIEGGMKLKRSEVYILNILKCRPPDNRNPTPQESANCRLFLQKQIDLIAPDFICCLGAVAAHNLLETKTPIGKLRGAIHTWRETRVVCTYHPAYLLRNPPAKSKAWEDLQLLMREMGLEG